MDQLLFGLSHYCALAALAVLSYTFGRKLTHGVSYHSLLEQVSFSVALGLGFISYLVFLLGLLGLLYRSVVLLTLLAGFLACYRIWIRWPERLSTGLRQLRSADWVSVAIVTGVAIVLLALSLYIWILPLYPPNTFDSLLYHLPAAKIFARSHRLMLLENLRLPIFPQANHMLFTLALLVYDDILAQLVELLMLITLLAAVVAFGKRLFSERTGWWATALMLANPMVIWAGVTAYIDIGLTLYTTLTVYAFWNWLDSRQNYWLLLAGCYCGIGIGTKYPALIFMTALTLLAALVGLRERKWRHALVFTGTALLVAAPWFVRSFYYTRNPLFPFCDRVFASVFGYGLYQPEYYRQIAGAFTHFELGKSWQVLITLPWQLASHQSKLFSPLTFFLLPISLAFVVTDRRMRFLLALTTCFTLCWFFGFQQLRYLLPILPLISIAAVAPVDLLLLRWPLKERWRQLITAAGLIILMYPAWQYAKESVSDRGTLPVNQEQRDKYFTRAFPAYSGIKFLNDLGDDNYRVYGMFMEYMTYFSDGKFIGDWFGPGSYAAVLSKSNSGEALYKELKGLGADYFLTRSGQIAPRAYDLPQDSFFKSHFKPIFDAEDVHLFELTAVPFARKVNNLVQNAGFEELNNTRPTGWYFDGRPTADSSGKQSFTGQTSVSINRSGDTIYQSLPINAGQRYFFSCQARGVEQPGTVMLQANWYDKQGRLLKEMAKVFEVGVEWKGCEMNFEAPINAARVIAYASLRTQGPVWFDDFSFGTMTFEPLP